MRVCLALFLLVGPFIARTRGDAGLVRLSEQVGPYRLTVLTSPTPLRAGPVEISVFVESATDRSPVTADVTVNIAPRDRPDDGKDHRLESSPLGATVNVDLSSGGWWQVHVTVSGPLGDAEKTLLLEVGDALPRWREMIFWIALPLAPIGLYIVHQWLVRRRDHA